jgi:hypothetical protein
MLAMRIWGDCWSWWLKMLNFTTQELTAEGKKVTRAQTAGGGLALLAAITFGVTAPILLASAVGSMVPNWVSYVIGFGGWVGALAFLLYSSTAAERTYAGEEQTRMAARVKRLGDALAEASAVSAEIKLLLTAREAALELMQQQAADWETLADLNEERAKAVSTLVGSVMEKRVRHLDRVTLFCFAVSTAIAFGIGLFADQIKILK